MVNNIKLLDAICGFKVKKVVHQGWEEFERAKKKGIKLFPIFHKWQYIYSSEKGTISLIKLTDRHYANHSWEIYCLSEPKLFDDVERFSTKRDAVKVIKGYLL